MWAAGNIIIGGLITGAIYALLAVGYSLVFSVSGALNLAQGVGSWDLELAMTALDRAEATGAGHHLDLDMGQWRAGR